MAGGLDPTRPLAGLVAPRLSIAKETEDSGADITDVELLAIATLPDQTLGRLSLLIRTGGLDKLYRKMAVIQNEVVAVRVGAAYLGFGVRDSDAVSISNWGFEWDLDPDYFGFLGAEIGDVEGQVDIMGIELSSDIVVDLGIVASSLLSLVPSILSTAAWNNYGSQFVRNYGDSLNLENVETEADAYQEAGIELAVAATAGVWAGVLPIDSAEDELVRSLANSARIARRGL
jgi:hypothetical protein